MIQPTTACSDKIQDAEFRSVGIRKKDKAYLPTALGISRPSIIPSLRTISLFKTCACPLLLLTYEASLKPCYKVPDSASFIIVHVYHLTQENTTATSHHYHYHYHHLHQQHIATLAPHVCTHLHLLEVETSIDRAERDLLIKLATGMSTDLPTTLPCQVTTGYETRLPCEYCLSFGNMSSHTKLTISSQCVRKPPPKKARVCLSSCC